MATVTITLTDDETPGHVIIGGDFGSEIDPKSQAHSMGLVLLESTLTSAKSYTTIEDTAPDVNVEPPRVVVPN
jgi:hypothetical protein